MTRLVCVEGPLHARGGEGGEGGRWREGRSCWSWREVRGLGGWRGVAGAGTEVDRPGVGVGHVVITVELVRVPHGIAGTSLELVREVAGQEGMVCPVPARVRRETETRDGRPEALAHVDEVLHLVDPLALTPLVLEPDLDHSLGKTGVFGQFFKYFWRGLGVLVKTILQNF